MNDEGATIHLYSQDNFLPQAAAEALQRLSVGQLPQQSTASIDSAQQYTISFSNGQTILTPVDSVMSATGGDKDTNPTGVCQCQPICW